MQIELVFNLRHEMVFDKDYLKLIDREEFVNAIESIVEHEHKVFKTRTDNRIENYLKTLRDENKNK